MARQPRATLFLTAILAVVAALAGVTGHHGEADASSDRPASEEPAGFSRYISPTDPAFQPRTEPRRWVPQRQARTSPNRLAVLSAVAAPAAGLVWRRVGNETRPLPVPRRLLADAPHRGPPLPLG